MVREEPLSDEIYGFVKRHHYMGSLNGTQRVFTFRNENKLCAVATYGKPQAAKLPTEFLELRRLVAFELRQPLSYFLSSSLRMLKKDGVPAVLTWADQAQSHHGGIYQATNWFFVPPKSYPWNYHFKKPDGTILDHKAAFKMFGTSSKRKVLEINPTWSAFLPAVKLRYLMPLKMKLKKCLCLLNAEIQPYPKPEINGHLTRSNLTGGKSNAASND